MKKRTFFQRIPEAGGRLVSGGLGGGAAHTLGAPPPDPRYQSASGLPSYALAPEVRKASKKFLFLDILVPGRAMLHPDGLLGKRSFKTKTKKKRPCEVTRCTARLAVIRS